MPGSPYLEKTPKGLLTWQRFSKQFVAISILALGLGMYFDVLLYVIGAVVVLGTVRFVASN